MTTVVARARTAPPLWMAVTAGSVIAALSLGVRSTFGLLVDPVVDTLGTGRGPFASARRREPHRADCASPDDDPRQLVR